MRRRWSLAAATALLASNACVLQPDSSRTAHALPAAAQNANERPVLSAHNGSVRGTIGALTLDAQSRPASYDDGWYLSVESTVQLSDRAAMTLLSVSNGSALLAPGLHASFALADFNNDAPHITMLGCVGQSIGVYDEYDMPADDVDVDVVAVEEAQAGDTDAAMDVTATGRWYDRDGDGVRLATYRAATTQFTLWR